MLGDQVAVLRTAAGEEAGLGGADVVGNEMGRERPAGLRVDVGPVVREAGSRIVGDIPVQLEKGRAAQIEGGQPDCSFTAPAA